MAMLRRVFTGAGAAALLLAGPALAHHGWGGYGQENFSMSGTVEAAMLGNPHGVLRVRGSDGNVWTVTLGPALNQRRAGLTEAMLPAGTPIVAHGKRHLSATIYEVKTERLTVNKQDFLIYPDRLAGR